MAVTSIEQNTEASEPSPEPNAAAAYSWSRALIWAALAYALSRAAVIAGAGAVSAAQKPRPTSGTGPILDVLNSWDGAWYYEVARHGYPHHIPPNITFFQLLVLRRRLRAVLFAGACPNRHILIGPSHVT